MEKVRLDITRDGGEMDSGGGTKSYVHAIAISKTTCFHQ